ncbi:endo alpha-1,4 polygalactosaminidase [Sorangium sp. So ce1000]|uniref:endo alpha-1,4 polygalactosaminidase n=1 Tax=Sorangium sp. So ce1000 TaxID=3133325 RepID=UPI003F6116DF
MNRSWPAVVKPLIVVLAAAHAACGDAGVDPGGAGGSRPDSPDSSSTQCFEVEECEILVDAFLANGKAVFEVEYDDPFSGHMTDRSLFCEQANAWGFNSMEMPLDLDGGRWPCR